MKIFISLVLALTVLISCQKEEPSTTATRKTQSGVPSPSNLPKLPAERFKLIVGADGTVYDRECLTGLFESSEDAEANSGRVSECARGIKDESGRGALSDWALTALYFWNAYYNNDREPNYSCALTFGWSASKWKYNCWYFFGYDRSYVPTNSYYPYCSSYCSYYWSSSCYRCGFRVSY